MARVDSGEFYAIVGNMVTPAEKLKAALEEPAIQAAHEYYMQSGDSSVLAELAADLFAIYDRPTFSELRARLTRRWAQANGYNFDGLISEEQDTIYG